MENLADLGEPLKGGLLDNLSRFTGESPEATQRAFKAALPASIYAVTDYGSTEAGAKSLLGGLREGQVPELGVESLQSALADPPGIEKWSSAGSGFLDKILGPKMTGVVGALAQNSGVSRGAMSKVLSIAAPLALGVIGKRVRSGNFDAPGLARFLGEQKSLVGAMLPMELTSAFGQAKPPDVAGRRMPEAVRAGAAAQYDRPKRSYWPWVLAGLAAVIGIMSLLGRTGQRPPPAGRRGPVTAPRTPPAPRPPPGPNTAAPEERPLGDQLSTYFSGIDVVPKRFELKGYSTTNPQPADDLASALAAHPESKVRIEAFNPSTGDSVMDEAAAITRGEEVKEHLIAQGVGGERIEVVGTVLPDQTAPQRIDAIITRSP